MILISLAEINRGGSRACFVSSTLIEGPPGRISRAAQQIFSKSVFSCWWWCVWASKRQQQQRQEQSHLVARELTLIRDASLLVKARCFETIPLIKAGLPVWLEIETCGFWPWLFSFGNFHAEKRMTSGIALGGVGGTYQSEKSKVWSALVGWSKSDKVKS